MSKMLASMSFIFLLAITVANAGKYSDSDDNESGAVVDSKQVETIEERFEDRWQALIARDFGKAYAYESPVYRSSVDLSAYIASYHPDLTWTSVKVKEVEIEDETKAMVSYDLGFKFKTEWDLVLESTDSHTEEWFFKDDEWWHDKKTSVSPYSALNQK